MLSVSPFVAIPPARDGKSFEQWLDGAISEAASRVTAIEPLVAAGHVPEALAIAAEQARLTLVAVRAAI